MKIRKDFVTNSSSSSYICDACGHVESGWDISLSEAEMCECEKGHTICVDEMGDLTFEIKLAYLMRSTENSIKYTRECLEEEPDRTYYHDRLKREEGELAKLKTITKELLNEDNDLNDFFDKMVDESEMEYNYPSELCPLCNHNIIAEHDLINYACSQLSISKEQLVKATREFLIAKENK